MPTSILTKDKTLIIKGFAILFMIAHHCFIKEFYLDSPSILNSYFALRVQIGMKMCVGLFTFIIGYGGGYALKIDLRYIYSHVWRLLKQYWIVLAITLLIIIIHESSFKFIVGQREFGRVLLNMVGLNPYYNLGNWYIYFYIYALCIIPLLRRFLLNRVWVKTLILTVCCGIASYSIPADMLLFKVLKECLRYTPILVIGYVCAKTQILTLLYNLTKYKAIWALLAVVAVVFRCMASSIIGISTDIVCVPTFILSISALFIGNENSLIASVFSSLGKNSTLMWFIHALPFSSATRIIFQSSPLWINNVFVLFLVITIMSFLVSLIINKLFKKMRII